jgi:hypothetical protein
MGWGEGTYTAIYRYSNVTIFSFSSTEVFMKLCKHDKASCAAKATNHRKNILYRLIYVLEQSNSLCTEFFLSQNPLDPKNHNDGNPKKKRKKEKTARV